ncbi:hypothetical protein GI374_02525 [Paracoccus sp. S-4012]|uniref:hypothetical protein n=1 Tax=Paracoccus sp. S-4012 TaxID=2665648 RepID=UPI0012B0BFA3|nr:hypothetical protein [Paracoccus sp. S-4012]MRX49336.1 hypothetical protein [Paracoccus sp. S-4012]
MNIFLKSSVLAMAAAVATGIAAAPSFADGMAYLGLGNSARNQLLSSDVDANDLSTLTSAQMAELDAILHVSGSAVERNDAARAIIERSARNARLGRPAGESAHAAQLIAGADRNLRAAGIRDVDAATLSLGTVLRLSRVFSDHDGNGYAAEARAILNEAPRHARFAGTAADEMIRETNSAH